ncbi:MAG: aminotransferase class V-fold PLP-dependent enzyme [Alphaproteobacteria bacterium]|nr:aminotransferase class V-fold PLP-dependent enzyme [Alphaproteobacteria bacterium]
MVSPYARHFSRSIGRPGAPFHCAAHSHHAWPDVTLDAQVAAWDLAAEKLDHKWDHVFGTVMPEAQSHLARLLSLPDPNTITFGPNTHSFVVRLLSSFPAGRPVRILTTSSEFMSFSRQTTRMEEDGLVKLSRIHVEPFESFEERFAEAARKGGHDLVFFSHAFYDSGFRVNTLKEIVASVSNPATLVVIDGYHGFMAVPTDLSTIADRAFYLAGGYKFGMSGEGVCFLHCPPGHASRPRDTGWYAGFTALGDGANGVPYPTDGARFLGATFDVSGLYRFNAVQNWLAREGLTVAGMLEYGRGIERAFLAELARVRGIVTPSQLMVPWEERRSRFLAFRTEKAGEITASLAARDIIVDYRADRLRFGFSIYHDEDDARRMARALAS